ncbi:MAG TPA: choloylglycine hydrolase family protein [Rhabdochlamydiaceae bacterium]|nr:choloylglycine hydrolase family protein [Rhabdochlamydiaceae bacterium]
MKLNYLLISFMIVFCLISGSAKACTAFQLKSQEGASIYCRSMEFEFALHSELLIVPRSTEFVGTAPQKAIGMQWKCKYGYVGMNLAFAPTCITDGMNEKGLVVGSLYLPGLAKYERPDPMRSEETLGPWELPNFLLGMCASIEDVKNALQDILVAQEPPPGMGEFILPLHFYISDRSGKAIVVEYIKGEKQVHDNPIGVLTNSPSFDWHLINLRNYLNLSPVDIDQLDLRNLSLHKFGTGSGLLRIPGDYTPPSRFLRASFFSQWAAPQKTAEETVKMGFHILNTFDIFEGIVRLKRAYGKQKNPIPTGKTLVASGEIYDEEITEWIVVHDQTNLKTYFRNYDSLRIQMADLKKIDFSQPGFRKIPMLSEFSVDDVTNNILPLKMGH